jgi:Protein of unknown function (DUF742)
MDPAGHESASALVRPYALTGGRTRPRVDIAIEALVATTPRGRSRLREPTDSSQHRHALALCDRRPLSLAEVAALTRLPLGVARVLVADMLADGLVAVHGRTALDEHDSVRIDVLEGVLSGLRKL